MDDLIRRQAAIDKLKSIITDREYTNITDEAKERMAREFFADIPSEKPEVTEEDVKEYCRDRCLCIVDSALLKKY